MIRKGSNKISGTSKLVIVIGAIVAAWLFAFQAKAAVETYFFNNAVNTDPTELGNYWNDEDFTDPALQLPDFSEDVVHIMSGVTYAGDAVFNGNATNQGTVDGDALFIDDFSENIGGTITGTQTRRYTSDAISTRDFTSDGPWIVVADGAVVDVSTAVYDGTTTFVEQGSGYFLYLNLVYARSQGSTIVLSYDKTLDNTSIPSASDFSVTVNGVTRSVQSVGVSGVAVTLTLSSSVSSGDTVILDYVPGVNPIQDTSDKPAIAIDDLHSTYGLLVGNGPQSATLVGTKLYVNNALGNNVSVIDTLSDSVVATIPVGSNPTFSSAIGTKLYVNNHGGTAISVIDTLTDTVVDTISVPISPHYSIIVGTKLYVDSPSSTSLVVIDTLTDTVVDTAMVGTAPYYSAIVGRKLYVNNSAGDSVTVVDTATDDALTTIDPIATAFQYSTSVGDKVYVNDTGGDAITVIDTITDTFTDTIPLLSGTGPFFSTLVGTKLYALVSGTDSVSVIDTLTDMVVDTIMVGGNPIYSTIVGKHLFVKNPDDNSVSVIDTLTDMVVDTIMVGDNPRTSYVTGSKLFITNFDSDSVSIIDTNTIGSELPNLTNFTTSAIDGEYEEGDTISITAHFGRTLQTGSEMTILFNNGQSVHLDEVSGANLSGEISLSGATHVPDLSVASITSASVTDLSGNTRTSYDLPFSQGDFEGENSFITRNLGDVSNIEIGNFVSIEVGDNPYQISSAVTKGSEQYVYVANQGESSVSVVRLSDRLVIGTISVGDEPYGLTTVEISGTTYVYIANTLSDTVSVIDTSSDTVIATVDVGARPYYVAKVGTNVYVTNGASNTVSVIDANTNNIINTIPVGAYPRGIKAHGAYLYVANYSDENYSGGDYISVIDANTDTVADTIISPVGSDGPRGVNVLGDKVYVTNYRSRNVSVVDTNTNEIIDTVEVGMGPRGVVGYGANVYVENFDDGTLSIINANTNDVTDTLPIGHSPSGITVVGDDLYISAFQDGEVRIFDTMTGALLEEEQEEDEDSGGSSGSSSSPGNTTPAPPAESEPGVPTTEEPLPPIAPSPIEEIPSDPIPEPSEEPFEPAPSEEDSPLTPPDRGGDSEMPPIEKSDSKIIADIKGLFVTIVDEVSKEAGDTVSVAGLALPVVLFAITQPATAASIPLRLWNIIPTLLGFKRKKRPWGTVYDSVTKQPLDPVYVSLSDSNGKEIATTITDIDGRFGFLAAPGMYTISAHKDDYEFPSKKLLGKGQDELYNNLYFKETVEIKNQDELLIKNIPMDAQNFNWNEFEKAKNKKLMKFYSKRDLFLAGISSAAFYIGLACSVIFLFAVPSPFNYVVIGIYAVVMILRAFGIKPKKPGHVIEKETGFPLSFGLVKIFSARLRKEVAHAVIGKSGKYYILVPNGEYYMKISKKTGEDEYAGVLQSEPFTVKRGYVGKVIKV